MNTPDEMVQGEATQQLIESFEARRSRRSLLKGVAGAGGLAAASAGLFATSVHASAASGGGCVDSVKTILTIARTAERLAVTFFSNGVANADKLGLYGSNLEDIRAALIEEQIHELFLGAQGGGVLTSQFSFPHGPDTFTDLKLFLATLEQLEGVFDTAYLAAVREFAQLGRPDMAQTAAQIAWVEGMHLAGARKIGADLLGSGYTPSDNWAFAPVLTPSVGAVPTIVKKAGYLNPVPGNSYSYQQVSTSDPGVIFRQPFAVPCP